MSKPNKTIKLVVKDGTITSVYDDALIALFDDAEQVTTTRASHVEPDGSEWSADLSPVGGPMLSGFTTRQAALDAEVQYINQHVVN